MKKGITSGQTLNLEDTEGIKGSDERGAYEKLLVSFKGEHSNRGSEHGENGREMTRKLVA